MAHAALVARLSLFEQAARGHLLPHQLAFQRTEAVSVELALEAGLQCGVASVEFVSERERKCFAQSK